MKKSNFLPQWYIEYKNIKNIRINVILIVLLVLGNFYLYNENYIDKNEEINCIENTGEHKKNIIKDVKVMLIYNEFYKNLSMNMGIVSLECHDNTVSSEISTENREEYMNFIKKIESGKSFEIVNVSPITLLENKYKFSVEVKYKG